MRKRQELGFVWFIALVALAVRLLPALTSSMPLNDGGLFYAMINDLLKNNFAMPMFTAYNGGTLPFAYPPFAFYVSAIAIKFTDILTLDLLRMLPSIVSMFAIPAFYSLAKKILNSGTRATIASLLFAFTPLAFEWLIMGGGLTRSFGQVFAILTLSAAYDLYNDSKREALLRLPLWGTLTVLTHPEAALQTTLAALWMWISFGRSRRSFIQSSLSAIAIIFLAAPWWLTILLRFGIDPFTAVFSAAGQESIPWIARPFLIFQFHFTEEPYVTFTAALGLIGMFIALAKKEYFAPIWMLAALMIDVRSGARFAMMPLAMLASIALNDAIIPAIKREPISDSFHADLEHALLGTRTMKIFTAFLFISLAFGAFSTSQKIAQTITVQYYDREAMQWIADNTPSDAIIVAVTQTHPMMDPITEWMPVLTDRRVPTSAFGMEWLDGDQFGATIQSHRDLQACAEKDTACLSHWIEEYGSFSYIYLSDKEFPLYVYLSQSADYKPVYSNELASIFKRIK